MTEHCSRYIYFAVYILHEDQTICFIIISINIILVEYCELRIHCLLDLRKSVFLVKINIVIRILAYFNQGDGVNDVDGSIW